MANDEKPPRRYDWPRPGRPKGSTGAKGVDGLTPKQRAYTAARVAGATKVDAYRLAYSPNAKPGTAGGGASAIERSKAVSAVLERVRREMEGGQIWDVRRVRAWVHSQLLLEATTAPNPSARVKALELLGKDAGMFSGAKEERAPISAADLRARLQAKLLELQGNSVSSPDTASPDGDTPGDEPQAPAGEGDGTADPP